MRGTGGASCAEPTATFDPALAARGEQLVQQFGCTACHSVDGSKGIGPTLKGVWGSEVTLDSGETVVADEAYLRESILEPDGKTVRGFSPGVMTVVQPKLPEIGQGDKLAALVEYIRSLR